MKGENKIGPRMDPCGTPHRDTACMEKRPLPNTIIYAEQNQSRTVLEIL